MTDDQTSSFNTSTFDASAFDDSASLAGQLLIAMPQMGDPRFEQSLIYICAHSSDGAMGIVINRAMEDVVFEELLPQLGIEPDQLAADVSVQFGGPVEPSRGFVLHSADVLGEESMQVTDELALTATLDMLRMIATGEGPSRHIFALGYAGWSPGQLDAEIQANGWLTVEPNADLLFTVPLAQRWKAALDKLGIDPLLLSDDIGHA